MCKSKSTFAAKWQVRTVNAEDILPDPKKVEILQNWPMSRSVREVCSFLGLTN
jgi:hypothetical protein